MRLAILTWLAITGISIAQTTGGFSGGSGGGSAGGFGTGGGGGGGFTGGSGGSGTNAMQAGVSAPSLLGSFGSGTTGRNTNSAVSSSNLLSSYYYNPYAQGLVSGTSTTPSATGFGQAIYNANGAMSTGGGGASGRTNSGVSGGFGSTNSIGNSGQRSTGMTGTGTNNMSFGGGTGAGSNMLGTGTSTSGGFGGGNQSQTMGRNTGSMGFSPGNIPSAGNLSMGGRNNSNNFAPASASGLRPGILYPTNIGFPIVQVQPTQYQVQLNDVFTRSTSFVAPRNLRVEHSNGVVVLRGTVANQAEAVRAENLLRLEPGVRDIRNELTIQP